MFLKKLLALASVVGLLSFGPANAQLTGGTVSEGAAKSSTAKVGLALGGGGSRGSAHVGVLKVLVEEGVPIDLIAGTSIGSVVGGFYSYGMSPDAIAFEFTKDHFIKEWMPRPLLVKMLFIPYEQSPRLIGIKPYDGIYKGERFQNYVNKVCNGARIEQLKIPFAAICTNVVDGKSYKIREGDLGTAMRASTAVPGLKRPVQIGDKLYCDGGLICNVPVEHVKEMGADFVIAVNIDEHVSEVPLHKFRALGSMAKQALRIDLNHSDAELCAKANVVIHPNTDGITLISRKKSDGVMGIEHGVRAAREAMPEIRSKLLAAGIALKPKATSVD